MSRLDLPPNEELCGPPDVRIARSIAPGRTAQAGLRRERQQTMPRRMKTHFVNAITETIVRPKFRRMFIGIESERDCFRQAR